MFLLQLAAVVLALSAVSGPAVPRRKAKQDKLQLGVYYESNCPDSAEFVIKQLSPTYEKLSDIVNVTLVPFGNAKVKKEKGEWVFTCQHGPKECFGNMVQTCAIYLLKNTSLSIEFVRCMFMGENPPIWGIVCARKMGLDWKSIINCVKGTLGNQLEYKMAVATMSLRPRVTYVPWITIDGVHTDKMQMEAETDLFHLLCKMYPGKPPDICKEAEKVSQCYSPLDYGKTYSFFKLPVAIAKKLNLSPRKLPEI